MAEKSKRQRANIQIPVVLGCKNEKREKKIVSRKETDMSSPKFFRYHLHFWHCCIFTSPSYSDLHKFKRMVLRGSETLGSVYESRSIVTSFELKKKKKKGTACLIIVSMSTANIISCTLHYDFLERQRRLKYRPNVCRMETDSRNI